MKYTLNATKTPSQIDLIFLDGPNKGKTVKGIYQLKGDAFKLCLELPGGDRPGGFASKKGETFHSMELTRVDESTRD